MRCRRVNRQGLPEPEGADAFFSGGNPFSNCFQFIMKLQSWAATLSKYGSSQCLLQTDVLAEVELFRKVFALPKGKRASPMQLDTLDILLISANRPARASNAVLWTSCAPSQHRPKGALWIWMVAVSCFLAPSLFLREATVELSAQNISCVLLQIRSLMTRLEYFYYQIIAKKDYRVKWSNKAYNLGTKITRPHIKIPRYFTNLNIILTSISSILL